MVLCIFVEIMYLLSFVCETMLLQEVPYKCNQIKTMIAIIHFYVTLIFALIVLPKAW